VYAPTALGSVFLIVLAILLFFYWKLLSGGRKFTVVTGQGYSTMRVKLGKWRVPGLRRLFDLRCGHAASVSCYRLVHHSDHQRDDVAEQKIGIEIGRFG